MTQIIITEPDFTKRTSRLVGRKNEIGRLQKALLARGERHCSYYWAEGGLGKTRLLEELQEMVKEAGPGYHSSGIIDLFHTDTHSTSDVERAIVDGLDREEKYFQNYRPEREKFELLRERGTDPGVLERHRQKLSKLFVQDCREMAHDARKLVICFDTIELLQYESSAVEEKAGLDTVDTRIKPWLLNNLPQLSNVLIVFSGRPKKPAPGETLDPQARLLADLKNAFGTKDFKFESTELESLNLEEAQEFIQNLTKGKEIIPLKDLPVVWRLTDGRPIFLHLIVDLVQALSVEPRAILALFEKHINLINLPKDDPLIQSAHNEIERKILDSLFNGTGTFGECLERVALMPKGVDKEILQLALGWPENEIEQFLAVLKRDLSFVKRYKALPGAERLHGERLFLHDEMYELLTKQGIIRNIKLRESEVAHDMVVNYYNPLIEQLEREITPLVPEQRIPLRERLQKLQVERLYYLLAQDPRKGYSEYKRLSDQANRHRWVGFSMRLLDEFLRFYNSPQRRKQFESAGLSHEQILRESTQLWVERFHWWGQYERAIVFTRQIVDQPGEFSIQAEDLGILGNICALGVRAQAVLHGYEPKVVEEAKTIFGHLQPLADSEPDQILARARLSTTIGYQYRLGGLLAQASEEYAEANAAFRKLDDYPDELAGLLNNQAFAYAKQGRMSLAQPLANEALEINEEIGNEYSTGMTLSTLGAISRIRGYYDEAIKYGEEALDIFRELQDVHGTNLAYLSIAAAKRRKAKQEVEKGRNLEEAYRLANEAFATLQKALEMAKSSDFELGADIIPLQAELGRTYRELGHIASRLEGSAKGLAFYRQAEHQLQVVLQKRGWGIVDQADTVQDLAEVLFFSGDPMAAEQQLQRITDMIGPDYVIIPGEKAPARNLPHEYFAPLAKAEMLRGQMAFTQGLVESGLKHYLLAYAYFMRFSPDAVEKENLTKYLYNHLRRLNLAERNVLLQSIQDWINKYDLSVDVIPFFETLSELLGV